MWHIWVWSRNFTRTFEWSFEIKKYRSEVGQVGKFLGVNELRSTWMEVSRTTSESFFLNLFYSVLEKNGEAEEEI